MTTQTFDTLRPDQLVLANGGISAAASWIMQHESGGSTTAGHLHAVGRGDGTPGNHSSAFGAFQMIEATRKHNPEALDDPDISLLDHPDGANHGDQGEDDDEQ